MKNYLIKYFLRSLCLYAEDMANGGHRIKLMVEALEIICHNWQYIEQILACFFNLCLEPQTPYGSFLCQ